MERILCSFIILFFAGLLNAQEVILPLQVNPYLDNGTEEKGLKAGLDPVSIEFDLDSTPFIIVDDFSYNSHRPANIFWKDRSVYVNRNFPVNAISIGVATFDGLDDMGYPYNFITPTSYGSCDTLTSLPMDLTAVDPAVYDPLYLSFFYQPQGLNPFGNSPEDSLSLEFYKAYRYDTTIVTVSPGVFDTIIDTIFVNSWIRMWGSEGYNLHSTDTSCKVAFRTQTIKVPQSFYQDSFQFRFRSFGNTSGSVDHWHLDMVILSSDAAAHANLGDYAFKSEIGSLIEKYESMPWFHYVGNETLFARTRRAKYNMRNTFGSNVEVDLEYRANDEQGNQVDSIITVAVTPINAKTCKTETMPVPGDPEHTFIFPSSSAPANSTTYFLKKTILKRRIGPVDLIEQNNTVDLYQIFGSYYAYDDGSAEAGYGVKSDKGKVALRFALPEGMTDTLTSVYIHFNPVVFDRSEERFRLTVWDNNAGEPGDVIYESIQTSTPVYPKEGVNKFTKIYLDQSILVSDTFFVGYQKITEDVLNIGYDLNRKNNNQLFYSIGSGWLKSSNSSSIPPGSLMIRPSFRHVEEPVTGVIKQQKTVLPGDLKLYPNPVSDYLTILVSGQTGTNWFGQIYSVEGRLAGSFEMTDKYIYDLTTFSPGLYIVRITDSTGGSVLNGKFLVYH